MRVTRRRKGLWLLLAVIVLTLLGRLLDVPRVTSGPKGDEATYISMALSLAHDGDLRYERADYQRFASLYPRGPNGIFLKRTYEFSLNGSAKVPVSSDQSLSYGKALIYPVVAAPFVLVGGLGGMLVFNGLLLGLCVWCGGRFAAAATASSRGWFIGILFLGASVVPVFAVWLTSEMFNFALVFVAYFLWLYKKVAPAGTSVWLTGRRSTLIAALLIGAATFSKATNAGLIGPIALDAMFQRQFKDSLLVGVMFLIGAAGLFGVNALVTGEANYQGAAGRSDRRSFYDEYPFDDRGTRFEAEGNAMVTNDADTGRVLAAEALEQVPANIYFFLVGRHSGLVPYYFPGVLLAIVWLRRARRAPLWQWTVFLALVGSAVVLIVFFPDSWNGGGGPPGNRYFLSLYPPLLFLIQPGVSWLTALTAGLAGTAFTGAMVLQPFAASAAPWRNVERRPLRWLPIELTLLMDLPVRLNPLRGAILFIEEPTVQLFYMDGNTYSAEGDGLWVAGRDTAEIVVRTERPLKRMDVRLRSPIENAVKVDLEGRIFNVDVQVGQEALVQVARPLGFRYHQSYAYILRVTTSNGFVPAESEPGSTDTRNLGVFVRPTFFYDDVPK